MKHVKRLLVLFMITAMLPCAAIAQGAKAGQQITMTYADTTQANKSIVRQWHAQTPFPLITAELDGILNEYREAFAGTLQKPANKTTRNSRLDLDIRWSQTGDQWISFLLSARVTYHREILKTEVASRTYDMQTGQPITLGDVFAPDSEGWAYLKRETESQIRAYFPDEAPDESALLAAMAQIEKAEFTLHAMSLVLHYPAEQFYSGRHTLIEVTVMYPQMWDMMTPEAFKQTDNRDKKMVALTYDDGPMRTPTSQLLNVLMQYGARGTFFLIGTRIAGEKDLVQRQHAEGHAIAAHNWTHGDPSKISAGTLRTYRTKFDAALCDVIGIPSRYDRVPYGLYPQMVSARAGWPYIQWSLDTYDWRGRSPKTIYNTIKKNVTDGDIILFHDIKSTSADTAAKVIPYLQEQGYLLVTIDELFARDNIMLENEKVYYRCVDGDTSRK